MMAMLLYLLIKKMTMRNVCILRKVTRQGNQTESLEEFLPWNAQPVVSSNEVNVRVLFLRSEHVTK